MLLFFDTETTGLPQWHSPITDSAQPHLVQLAALFTDNDGTEVSLLNVIIRPEGWTIPVEASNVHGITTERAYECGVPLKAALSIFNAMLRAASKRVAHNISFDDMLVSIAAERVGAGRLMEALAGQPTFCTMNATTNICKIPSPRARHQEDYKWPKLSEAYKHFFNEELVGAHDALVDVRACKRIYFALNPYKQAA